MFRDTYQDAWQRGYRGLTPANLYNVDYSMLGTARVEPMLRRIRNAMSEAGMVVESSKGEGNLGQRDLFASSQVARAAFGAEVVDHYLNMAQVELDAFDAAVTDWERYRGFERL